jgi:sulfonate transport system ATP-binding protein
MTAIQEGAHLKIQQISIGFKGTPVLEGLNLEIQPGEFVAIVGRSGCGKSTLLRLVAGLEEASAGAVYVDNHKITGINDDIRVLFQDARLLPWKKVIENVDLGVKPADKVRAEKSGVAKFGTAKSKAEQALSDVGLLNRAFEWPAVLSGGQRQRVALARALACEPRLLLLDEPLGALDALTRIEMQQLIERLWLEQGFTVLLVTHDVSEAVAMADRVVLIEDGGISMDLRISLSRPRERDSGFAHYEKLILDRVLTKREDARETKENAKEYLVTI